MYLGEFGDMGDNGLGFSFKKLVRQITAPVLKAQQSVHAAVVRVVPGKGLKSLVGKISASAERATAQTMRPFDTATLLKAEAQQIKSVAQTKDVQKIAAGIIAAAAIYFTAGAATPYVMGLLKVAADVTAKKKAQARSAQEAADAQAEFDAYAKQLASQSAAGALPTAGTAITPGYTDASGAPAYFPGGGGPVMGGSAPSPYFASPGSGDDVAMPRRASVGSTNPLANLPPWALPATVAAAALFVVLKNRR